MAESKYVRIWVEVAKEPTNEVEDWTPPDGKTVIEYLEQCTRRGETDDGWEIYGFATQEAHQPVVLDHDADKTVRAIVGKAYDSVPDGVDTITAVEHLADAYTHARRQWISDGHRRIDTERLLTGIVQSLHPDIRAALAHRLSPKEKALLTEVLERRG